MKPSPYAPATDATFNDDSFDWKFPFQGVIVRSPFDGLAHFGVGGVPGTDSADPMFGLLDLHGVAAALAVHPSTVKRLMAKPAANFPTGYKVAHLRARRWKRHEVQAWIDANLARLKPGQRVDD